MNNDDHLKQAFRNLRFADEPPMASTADDVHRGRRGLRRRRVTTLASGVAMLAVVATGVAIALPGENGGQQPDVANSPSAPFDEWPKTSQRMQDALVEHLDPGGEHLSLDEAVYGADTNGESGVLSLDWLKVELPAGDAAGAGSVTTAVSAPIEASMAQPADSPDYMRDALADLIGPGFDEDSWTEQEVPGVDGTVWYFGGTSDDAQFAVIHVREDTSVTGVAVKAETSDEAGPGLTVEQAVAFVTEPDLVIDPSEFNIGDTSPTYLDDGGDDWVAEEFQFPETAQHLDDAARRHFGDDISEAANPLFATAEEYGSADQSYGGTGGGRVDWTLSVPVGSDQWGSIEVSMLTPAFAATYFSSQPWMTDPHDWKEETVPGTNTKVWIADETKWTPEVAEHLAFAVAYEQADGSIVIAAVDKYSDIDIEQAYDLVTDPDLQIDPAESTGEYWQLTKEKREEAWDRATAEAGDDL